MKSYHYSRTLGKIEVMPRYDLREPAFRRYEPYIAKALQGSYLLNPMAELGVSPATFIARFRDAILAKQRFGYKSISVSCDALELNVIRAYQTPDGNVTVENVAADCRAQEVRTAAKELDFAPIDSMRDEVIAGKHPDGLSVDCSLIDLPHIVDYLKSHPRQGCAFVTRDSKVFFFPDSSDV